MKRFNASKVFATLILLAYKSILSTSMRLLTFVRVRTETRTLLQWAQDPTVPYFGGAHAIVFFLAVLVLLLCGFFTALLLLHPLLIRWSKANRWLFKLKPFFDAFEAPFKLRYRFWAGCRMAWRWVISLLSLNPSRPGRIFVITLILLLQTTVEAYLCPFKSAAINAVSFFLLCELMLVLLVALFNQVAMFTPSHSETVTSIYYSELVLLTIVSAMVVILFVAYVLRSIPACRRGGTLLKEKLTGAVALLSGRGTPAGRGEGEGASPAWSARTAPTHSSFIIGLSKSLSSDMVFMEPLPNSYSQLREPLLEEPAPPTSEL